MLNDLNPDFQDLIKSLTDQHVDFLVVGAHALAFHGIARYTQDLDIWVNRTSENIHKLGDAMSAFGLPISDDALHQMLEERKFLRFGHEPTKIEVLNFLDGCNFELAFRRASHETLGDVQVAIIGLEDYVATKRASGRPKDASDLSLLRSMIGQLPGDVEST